MLEIFQEPPVDMKSSKVFYSKAEACDLENGYYKGVLDSSWPQKESIVFNFGKSDTTLYYFVNVYDLEAGIDPYEGYYYKYDCIGERATALSDDIIVQDGVDAQGFFRYGGTVYLKHVSESGSAVLQYIIPAGIGVPIFRQYYFGSIGSDVFSILEYPFIPDMSMQNQSLILDALGEKIELTDCTWEGKNSRIGGRVACGDAPNHESYYVSCTLFDDMNLLGIERTDGVFLQCTYSLCEEMFHMGGANCDSPEEEKLDDTLIYLSVSGQEIKEIVPLPFPIHEMEKKIRNLVEVIVARGGGLSTVEKIDSMLERYDGGNMLVVYILSLLKQHLVENL